MQERQFLGRIEAANHRATVRGPRLRAGQLAEIVHGRGVAAGRAAPAPFTVIGGAECRTLPDMSSPEVERRLRQQGADVDALYEISARIEGKVDAVDAKVVAVDAKVDQLAERTNARFDHLEQTLTQILERLDRD